MFIEHLPIFHNLTKEVTFLTESLFKLLAREHERSEGQPWRHILHKPQHVHHTVIGSPFYIFNDEHIYIASLSEFAACCRTKKNNLLRLIFFLNDFSEAIYFLLIRLMKCHTKLIILKVVIQFPKGSITKYPLRVYTISYQSFQEITFVGLNKQHCG